MQEVHLMLNFTVSVITIDNITVTSATTDTTIAATTRRPWCFGGRAAVLGGGDDGASAPLSGEPQGVRCGCCG
jgi:hypothetical protein